MKRLWRWLRFRLVRRFVDLRELIFPGEFRKTDTFARRCLLPRVDGPEEKEKLKAKMQAKRLAGNDVEICTPGF